MKKIGIAGWNAGGENKFIGVSTPYLQFLSKFGKVQILTPWQDPVEGLDLLVLPGGADVDASRYGQIPGPMTGCPNPLLEAFDKERLPEYLEMGTPMLCICRGMQSLWVHLGGSLIQHIAPYHAQSSGYPEQPAHSIVWDNDFQNEHNRFRGLNQFKGKEAGWVTSRHHQACDPRTTPEGVRIVGWADDETVEVFTHFEKKILAVQYHPESNFHEDITEHLVRKLLLEEVHERA